MRLLLLQYWVVRSFYFTIQRAEYTAFHIYSIEKSLTMGNYGTPFDYRKYFFNENLAIKLTFWDRSEYYKKVKNHTGENCFFFNRKTVGVLMILGGLEVNSLKFA